jgi:hypothetical protein
MIRRSPGRSRRAPTLARRRGRTAPRPSSKPENHLDGAGHPHLAPSGWAVGKPVREFLTQGPLPTAEAVAVTLAVLSALGSLHREGRVHGGVSEDAVGVAADGWVRLAAAAAGDGSGGRADDLHGTGVLLCRLLGVGTEDNPRLPSAEAERTAPALVALARSLARRPELWSAEDSWSAVKEAAGYWGAEPQLVHALAALAERVEGATAIERAVTRIVIGPPLRTEPPAPVHEPRSIALPELDLRAWLARRPRLPSRDSLPSVPSLPSLPSLPQLSAPAVYVPRVPVARPGRRFLIFGTAALLVGLLVGGVAGAHSALTRPRPAAAAAPAHPKHSAPPAQPAGLYAQTPSAAVSMFFQLVRDHQLDRAALLWKPKMAASVDLASRFSGITSVDLRRSDTVAEDDSAGIATVEVDWVETHADGSTHEFIGEIYTDTGPVLWRWDSWNVHEVVADGSGSSGGGDGG